METIILTEETIMHKIRKQQLKCEYKKENGLENSLDTLKARLTEESWLILNLTSNFDLGV